MDMRSGNLLCVQSKQSYVWVLWITEKGPIFFHENFTWQFLNIRHKSNMESGYYRIVKTEFCYEHTMWCVKMRKMWTEKNNKCAVTALWCHWQKRIGTKNFEKSRNEDHSDISHTQFHLSWEFTSGWEY